LSLIVGIGTGCLCGLVNGLLISYLKMVPFIVTLGTMQLYLGWAKWVADNTTVRPDLATQVPRQFADLLSIRPTALVQGMPVGVWLTLGLALLLAGVLHFTVFGRYVFAIGSNEATARLCGINVRWNKIAIYTLAGLFVGIAGLYQFSRLTVGNPSSGTGLELKVIASVIIGGGSLNGGRASVLGTLTGALIMSVITSGCTALGVSNPIQDMLLGVIIIIAVAVDQWRQAR
jgi:ribose transport system permease protein